MGQRLLKRTGEPMDLSTMVLIEKKSDGTVASFTKSTAVLRTCSRLNKLWPVLYYIGILFPAWFRDFVYAHVAANRHRLFGTNGGACKLPDVVLRKRILRQLPPFDDLAETN